MTGSIPSGENAARIFDSILLRSRRLQSGIPDFVNNALDRAVLHAGPVVQTCRDRHGLSRPPARHHPARA
jgi:hypothetical protein